MRKPPKHTLLASAAALGLAAAAAQPAHAQFGGSGVVYCSNCSDQVTQGLQQANQVAQLAKLASQYTTQLEQYALQMQQFQNMVQNTRLLDGNEFGQVVNDIQRMRDVIKSANGLAYTSSDLEGQFRAKYKSFGDQRQGVQSPEDMASRYQAWSEDTNDSVLTTMRALSVEADTMDDEAELMAKLQERASTAEGQMEALQVANEMAVAGVGQMQKLRSLQMLQIQLMAQDMQTRSDKEAAGQARAVETYTAFDKPFAGETY